MVSVASDQPWPPEKSQPSVQLGVGPDLPLAQGVAVRLVVVGGYAGAQPVHLVVAGQGHAVQLADRLEAKRD